MESAIEPNEKGSGAELAALTERRLLRAAILANGLGGLAVFTFGLLSPGSPDREDARRLALANAATFVFFMAIGQGAGSAYLQRSGSRRAVVDGALRRLVDLFRGEQRDCLDRGSSEALTLNAMAAATSG